jgi:hypothetical protein
VPCIIFYLSSRILPSPVMQTYNSLFCFSLSCPTLPFHCTVESCLFKSCRPIIPCPILLSSALHYLLLSCRVHADLLSIVLLCSFMPCIIFYCLVDSCLDQLCRPIISCPALLSRALHYLFLSSRDWPSLVMQTYY